MLPIVKPECYRPLLIEGLLAAHGFEAIGMRARTLRTGTACLALLALVHDAMRTRAMRERMCSRGGGHGISGRAVASTDLQYPAADP